MNINSLEIKKEIDSMIDKIYPIGSYYETSDTEFSPNNTWGGTWIEDSNGLVLIGANYNGDSSVEKNGLLSVNVGEKVGEATHKLTVNEIPAHSHNLIMRSGTGSATYGIVGEWSTVVNNSDQIKSTGGSQAHNNTQPSIGVRRWHRVA